MAKGLNEMTFDMTFEGVIEELKARYGDPDLWPPYVAFLAKEAHEARCDYDQTHETMVRLAKLLERVAIALKGPEPELVAHDWSDLPALAAKMKARLAELEKGTP